MLNGVFIHHHAFLAPVVFQPSQPETAAAEIVKITDLYLTFKFFIAGKAPIRRKQQKLRLDTFQIPIFFERPAKSRKRLIK